MKKYLTLIFIGLIVSGCATTNTASNRDILMAINKQSEAITNLTVAIRTPTPAPVTITEAPVKKSSPGLGYALTAADLHQTNTETKTSTDRTTLFPKRNSTDTDTETRLRKLEKKVTKLEMSDKKINQRVAALENARRKLSWEISQVGIDSFPGIVVGKFAKNSAKITSDIESQIKAVAEKYNAAAKNSGAGKLEVVVTGYNDKGGISEKRGTTVLRILEKYLSDKFDVKYTGEDDTAEQSLPGKVFISNPFIQTAS